MGAREHQFTQGIHQLKRRLRGRKVTLRPLLETYRARILTEESHQFAQYSQRRHPRSSKLCSFQRLKNRKRQQILLLNSLQDALTSFYQETQLHPLLHLRALLKLCHFPTALTLSVCDKSTEGPCFFKTAKTTIQTLLSLILASIRTTL